MTKEDLKKEIKTVRQSLYLIAKKSEVYSSNELVEKSQELDKLIFMYQTR
ncbi:aspartyl-phosphate phosphatase Spo0E family protein [Fictibacillus enclensis]|nr:aspartyl-phosphate phosphatase Spo0E family protein [Fictibacillus enclensis]MDM5336213.1 aspartyl-phosphate phosphatase Spo0E family protein [Fictibacillus enclensis]WHY72707.1 aspartyl-phosphate phosphatase Spo0E family protein [Fictibacillus enclensis]